MNFTLRPWTLNDLDDLVNFAHNFKIAKNMMDRFPHPYTIEDGIAFINSIVKEVPNNILAIEIQNKASGAIGIHPQADIYRKNAELGYWLAEPFWGKGIISKAIVEMVHYGFKNFDVDRIFARPFGTNIASQNALERAGFILEARFDKTIFKNGEYLDELVYAIRRHI